MHNSRVQLDFIFSNRRPLADDVLSVNGRSVPLAIVRSRKARRYVLRVRSDGSARLVVPRGGSIAEARRFAERHSGWLEQQLNRFAARPRRPREWVAGTEILFRGQAVKIEPGVNGRGGFVRFADEWVKAGDAAANLRPLIEKHLRQLAVVELPARVLEFAAMHRLVVRRVTVRNQRTRWGSCSRQGSISLNWRLIQTPPFVRDYIILHELMHLRQMNHSPRFWREVEKVCPDYRMAWKWLKQNPGLLDVD